jgi:hypothetical protein
MYVVPIVVLLESRKMFIIIAYDLFPQLGTILNLLSAPVLSVWTVYNVAWLKMEIDVIIDYFVIWPSRPPFRRGRTENWCRAKLCVKWELSTSAVVVLLISGVEESPLLLLPHPYSLWQRSASRPIPQSLWWTFVMTSYSHNRLQNVNEYVS